MNEFVALVAILAYSSLLLIEYQDMFKNYQSLMIQIMTMMLTKLIPAVKMIMEVIMKVIMKQITTMTNRSIKFFNS